MSARCSSCGRFLGEPARVIPVLDSVHPYTCDYKYLCSACGGDLSEPADRGADDATE